MRRSIVFSFFFFLLSSKAFGQSPFSADVDSLIHRGIDQTYNSEFDSALATFQKIVDAHPDHIAGYFYQAAVLQSQMMDYETDLWEEEFYAWINKAIEIGSAQIEGGDANAWTRFYMGSCHSYKGLYQAKAGGLISGIKSARKGLACFSEAIEMDSTLYDAYLGIGNYKYWSGKFYKFFRWLPWISDERDEGVLLVILSINRGMFSHWVGINSLAWIEYDRKQYASALGHFLSGLERYPKSRFFLWGAADAYFQLGIYDKAAEIYEELLVSIRNGLLNNGYNEVICRFKLVKTYFAQRLYEETLRHCDAILKIETDAKITKKIKERREKTEDYRRKCIQAIKREAKTADQ